MDCVSDEMLIGQRSVCGVLMVLAGMLKHGKRDDLNDFGNVFIVFVSIVDCRVTIWHCFIAVY